MSNDIDKFLNEHIFYMASQFLQTEHSTLVELDAGDGYNASPFVNACDETTSIVLVNASGYARRRFKDSEQVKYTNCDYRSSYPLYGANLTLSQFSLDKYSPSLRCDILRNAYNKTLSGGALILVSRIIPYSPLLTKPVDEAELSLHGLSSASDFDTFGQAIWTESMLEHAGFDAVECFYRSFSVAAWIAVRK
jgi:hypothetical protein